MREPIRQAALALTVLLVMSQASACGREIEDSQAEESPERQCVQIHPSEGSDAFPDSWPASVSASWIGWVEELGNPVSVVQIPITAAEADRAAQRVPSIDASTPSAVCRIEFADDGLFMPDIQVRAGDEADVVLWETDIRTLGYGTTPKHGYAVGVSDPASGEFLGYVERG